MNFWPKRKSGFANSPFLAFALGVFNVFGFGYLFHFAQGQNFGGGGFPITTSVAVNSPGSITVNSGGSIVPAGTGTITATNGVGYAAAPIMAYYFGPNCLQTNLGNCYYTPADTQEADDCGWTAGQPDVNCTASHFVPTDVGKSVMGGRTCAAFQSNTVLGAQPISVSGVPTIATYVSGTHITISANASGTEAITSSFPQGGCFIWGHPDDTYAATFETAYSAAPVCPKVEMTGAYYLFSQPHFTTQPTACLREPAGVGNSAPNGNGANYGNIFYSSGVEFEGRGSGTTIWYLLPNFPNGVSCNLGFSALGCFVIPVEGRWRDFQISGGYQSNPANMPANTRLITMAVASLDNFVCTNFGAFSTVATIGLEMDWQSQGYQYANSGCGNIGITTISTHGQATCIKCSVENAWLNDVIVGSNASGGWDFACYDCRLQGNQATSAGAANPIVVRNVGGRVFLEHTLIGPGTANLINIGYQNDNATGVLQAKDSYILIGGAASTSTALKCVVACNITLENTQLTATAAGFDYQDVSGSKFRSLGGNDFTSGPFSVNAGSLFQLNSTDIMTSATGFSPTCTFTSGGGTVPSCALQAGSTNERGVIIATTGTGSPGSTGTVTLTFVGTYSQAAVTPVCTYSLDNSGTAWGAESIVFVSTQSTTAPVLAWTNINAIALAALATSSPYRIGYNCTAR